jgi:hypothetical protein
MYVALRPRNCSMGLLGLVPPERTTRDAMRRGFSTKTDNHQRIQIYFEATLAMKDEIGWTPCSIDKAMSRNRRARQVRDPQSMGKCRAPVNVARNNLGYIMRAMSQAT